MTSKIASLPRKIFKAHPIFGWTLTPGKQVQVHFRTDVIQNVDALGNRQNPGADTNPANKKLAIYGCSFTYGTGLADTETYPALLQQALPGVNVINKGVGGHSSVQALLRFRSDIIENNVNMAIFGIISDHRYRNLPHPYRMRAHLSPDWYKLGVEQVPHARLNRSGNIHIVYTPTWQPVLLGNDFEIFLPDEYVLDLIAVAIFREILALAMANDIPVIFALLDQLDVQFNQLMTSTFREAHDVSTPYNETYCFLPHDIHPNGLANQCFAERLQPIIRDSFLRSESE
jgi:hypothetical protein